MIDFIFSVLMGLAWHYGFEAPVIVGIFIFLSRIYSSLDTGG